MHVEHRSSSYPSAEPRSVVAANRASKLAEFTVAFATNQFAMHTGVQRGAGAARGDGAHQAGTGDLRRREGPSGDLGRLFRRDPKQPQDTFSVVNVGVSGGIPVEDGSHDGKQAASGVVKRDLLV